jgi:hypothetical protein
MTQGIVQPDAERLQWIATKLHIVTKGGQRVLLTPNSVQLRLHMAMQQQRCRGLPVRLDLLKFRQWGGSTWLEAEGFYEVMKFANWRAMAVSVDADSTDHIFGMTKIFEEDLPAGDKRPKDATNRKEIKFTRPHRSQFIAQTAGKISLGHSFTAQFLHCSEIARWENAETQMGGLQEIVPLRAGTTIVRETTANGQGGFFYDAWRENVRRRRRHPDDYSGYLPVFVGWYMFPDYAIAPRPGTVFSREERALQHKLNLTDAQLYWRRTKLAEMNGDLGLFQEQYPSCWEEAFQVSGNPVFSAEIQTLQRLYLATGGRRRVVFDETSGTVEPVDTDELLNSWLVRAGPREDHDYAIGIDSMEGRLSDVNNPKSALDTDGITVLDRNTGEVVAIYQGRTDQRELAKQAYRAAVWYHEAFVGPEMPASMVLLSYFKERNYPNLYNRSIHEDRLAEGESEVLGWRTTSITRKWLVDDFVVAAKEGGVKVVFEELLEEMQSFVRNKNGRAEALPGEHDDLLFSAMIALQVHKRCPLSARAYRSDQTGDDGPRDPGRDVNELAYAGAVDNLADLEDDEDEETLTE